MHDQTTLSPLPPPSSLTRKLKRSDLASEGDAGVGSEASEPVGSQGGGVGLQIVLVFRPGRELVDGSHGVGSVGSRGVGIEDQDSSPGRASADDGLDMAARKPGEISIAEGFVRDGCGDGVLDLLHGGSVCERSDIVWCNVVLGVALCLPEETMRTALVQSHDGRTIAPDLTQTLARAATGEEGAWRELVALYGRRVFALARSRVGGDEAAEEIAQSVFATIAIKLREGGYSEQGRFEPWLFRIAMNRIRDAVRHAKRRSGTVALDGSPEPSFESNDGPSGHAERVALRGAIERLSDADREIIELRHHAGMGFKEMAELLDEPVGTLLARHHRALRKLREMLGPVIEDQEESEGES